MPREIGVEGWPLDPNDPVYRPAEPLEAWRARKLRERLSACEKAWQQGSEYGLIDAILECHAQQAPLPEWATRAVVTRLLGKVPPRKRGRLGAPGAAQREDRIHYTRWEAVRELRERQPEMADIARTWEETYVAVSDYLCGDEAAGSPRAVKESYLLVQRAIKQGQGGRFYIPWRYRPR